MNKVRADEVKRLSRNLAGASPAALAAKGLPQPGLWPHRFLEFEMEAEGLTVTLDHDRLTLKKGKRTTIDVLDGEFVVSGDPVGNASHLFWLACALLDHLIPASES